MKTFVIMETVICDEGNDESPVARFHGENALAQAKEYLATHYNEEELEELGPVIYLQLENGTYTTRF